MTVEQLLLVLVLLLVPLLQSIAPVFRRRLEEQARRASESSTGRISPGAPAVAVRRLEIRKLAHHAPLPIVTPPTALRRARSPLGSLREVRRGIILMTLLGPCRGLDSSELRRTDRVQ